MVIKTQLPKIGSKFGPDEFRINSLCMSFYNHITTVEIAERGALSAMPIGTAEQDSKKCFNKN